MKASLIKTARDLKAPPETAALEFAQKQEHLAALGTRTLNQRPDLEKLVGPGNPSMAEDNNRNFARFMTALFSDYDPEVFVDTVLWVFRAYRSHGFHTTYWAANLNIWTDMLKIELSPETGDALYPFYNWLIIHIPAFTRLTDDAVAADK